MIHAREMKYTHETLKKVTDDIDPINAALQWNAKLH